MALEPDVVRSVRREASGRGWRHLARERIEDVEPEIPLGKRFWRLTEDERQAIEALFGEPDIHNRALALAGLGTKGRIRVVDAAYWRKGFSSLGTLRYAVLIGITEKNARSQYSPSSTSRKPLPRLPHPMPMHPCRPIRPNGWWRARALTPNLGERMIAARLLSKPVVRRELAPQDLKIEVEQFSRKEAIAAATYFAYVVGIAHARQLSDDQRLAWLETLAHRRAGELDAPSWLWRAIIDLAGAHEAGYLEHCRQYALSSE